MRNKSRAEKYSVTFRDYPEGFRFGAGSDIIVNADVLDAYVNQERESAKREVLKELLDWHEYDSANKYNPPREFNWEQAVQNMLLQKGEPHGPFVKLHVAETELKTGNREEA